MQLLTAKLLSVLRTFFKRVYVIHYISQYFLGISHCLLCLLQIFSGVKNCRVYPWKRESGRFH